MGSNEKFSEWFNRELERTGTTLTSLAEKVGVTQAYLSQLRSGKKEHPRRPVVEGIAREFGVSVAEVPDPISRAVEDRALELLDDGRLLQERPSRLVVESSARELGVSVADAPDPIRLETSDEAFAVNEQLNTINDLLDKILESQQSSEPKQSNPDDAINLKILENEANKENHLFFLWWFSIACISIVLMFSNYKDDSHWTSIITVIGMVLGGAGIFFFANFHEGFTRKRKTTSLSGENEVCLEIKSKFGHGQEGNES